MEVATGVIETRVVEARALRPPSGLTALGEDGRVELYWAATDTVYTAAYLVYRSLTPGRWVVTVTGDGSLGLAQGQHPAQLAPPPPVKDYQQLQSELAGDLDSIGPGAVLYRFISPDG